MIVSTSVVAVILTGVLVVIVANRSEPEPARPPTSVDAIAMQQWWSAASEHFDELQSALEDSRAALERRDEPALEPSCQERIDAAINDAHNAAHMCLSAVAGSLNNYAGEFESNLDQADKHLKAALDIVNKGRLAA